MEYHQRLNKLLFFFFLATLSRLHYIQEISKGVYKKSLSCTMSAKPDKILCDQHAHTWPSLVKTTLLIFADVQVKIQDFVQSLVAFHYSNIS